MLSVLKIAMPSVGSGVREVKVKLVQDIALKIKTGQLRPINNHLFLIALLISYQNLDDRPSLFCP